MIVVVTLQASIVVQRHDFFLRPLAVSSDTGTKTLPRPLWNIPLQVRITLPLLARRCLLWRIRISGSSGLRLLSDVLPDRHNLFFPTGADVVRQSRLRTTPVGRR